MNTALSKLNIATEERMEVEVFLKYPLETFQGKITTIDINLNPKVPYHFGYEIEDLFLNKLNEFSYDRIFIFTEKHLYGLMDTNLIEILKTNKKPTDVIFLDGGELNKSFGNLSNICDNLIDMGVTKDSILLAFGGGAIGNIVGLAAALIFRGIRFVEIPTNFMSQTDSTLSNKQAVNGSYGKNHFGVYHAPIFIWADARYVETEPKRTIQAGLVESIKNGFISNKKFLLEIEKYVHPDNYSSSEMLCQLVFNSVLSKNEILKNDPSEKDYGIILEYGHTFGHALEWMSKGELLHGEAVAIGMRIAAELGYKMNQITREEADYHDYIFCEKLLLENTLPESISSITPDTWIDAMFSDNKKRSNGVQFVLLDGTGKCASENDQWQISVEPEMVTDVLSDFISKWAR